MSPLMVIDYKRVREAAVAKMRATPSLACGLIFVSHDDACKMKTE
jgi:hypothetical protein